MHVVLEMTRQIPGGIPSHLRVAKVYYQQDVNKILAELQNAQSFGDGAAEEWRKGLVDRGKEAMADASRWEKWESQLGLGANLSQVLREYDPLFASVVDLEGESRSIGINGTQSAVYVHGKHSQSLSTPRLVITSPSTSFSHAPPLPRYLSDEHGQNSCYLSRSDQTPEKAFPDPHLHIVTHPLPQPVHLHYQA